MKKILNRTLPYLFILVIGFASFILPVQKTSAIGVVARVAVGSVGERVLAGVAEKAGINYVIKDARQKASIRFNKDAYDDFLAQTGTSTKSKQAMEYYANLTDSDIVPIPEKPGFGKVLVNTALFLTGADLLIDGYQALKIAYESQGEFIYSDSLDDKLPDYAYKNGQLFGFSFFIHNNVWVYGNENVSAINFGSIYGGINPDKSYFILEDYSTTATTITIKGRTKFYLGPDNYIDNGSYTNEYDLTTLPNQDAISSFVPTISDMPNVDLQPWANEISNIDLNTLPEQIPVEVPLTSDYPTEITTPWNNPVTDLTIGTTTDPSTSPEVEPVADTEVGILGQIYTFLSGVIIGTMNSIKTGVEGIKTGTDTLVNTLKNCKCTEVPEIWTPWSLFLPYASFALASIMFLINIAGFLLNLVNIPPKPIPSPYGDSFNYIRELQYGVIYPYDLMLSVVTLLLAFFIYKLIRRNL